jgi:hypothetical protein
MKKCPNCITMMEEVDVSGLPEQPADDSKIPGVPRVRSVLVFFLLFFNQLPGSRICGFA